jgi:diguanylate cyclase (GGDEF)-like protein
VANARRHDRPLAVCFLDLDGFKAINDIHGHEAGDHLLIQVAQRLNNAVRSGDTVCRLGGDEFIVLLTELEVVTELAPVLGRLLSEVARPYDVLGKRLEITASIGVTLFPADDADPDLLIRHADHAMYQAKKAGRNRYRLFGCGDAGSEDD